MLDQAFGAAILHEITTHRIEQFKRDRRAGKWGRGPVQPATVNRELDTLRSIFTKAVAWGKLLEHPMRAVKRLPVDNRRTRILTEDEQVRLLDACPGKLRSIVTLALTTGARIGELLGLRWDACQDGALTFLDTKNGKARRIPISPAIQAVLDAQVAGVHPWVFTNTRTRQPFTVGGVAHVFTRASRARVCGATTSRSTRSGTRPSAA